MSDAIFQVSVWARDAQGVWTILPDVFKITPDVAPDQLTTVTIDYPLNGRNVGLLQLGKMIAIRYKDATGRWIEPHNATYRLTDEGSDKVSRKNTTWVATSLWSEFDRAVLLQAPDFVPPVRDLGEFDQHYPRTWEDGSTVGNILARAIHESKARGELADIDTSLVNEAADSYGNPWSVALPPEEYKTFTPLTSLVKSLTEQGLVSIRFEGTKLLLVDPEHIGRNLRNTVELVPVRDITEAPSRRKIEALANRAYVKGDNAITEVIDSPTIDTSNVRAVAIEASGITDRNILQRIGALHLATVNRAQQEITVGIDCWSSKFLPWRDFDVDDLITVAYGNGGAEVHKVRQITIEQTDKGVRASIVLGDRMPDPLLKMMENLRAMQDQGVRSLGSHGPGTNPASSIRPGTPYAYDWEDGSGLRIGPDGFELTGPYGNPLVTNGGVPGGGGSGGSETHPAVHHGDNPNIMRPPGAVSVLWIGAVQPNFIGPRDAWLPFIGPEGI